MKKILALFLLGFGMSAFAQPTESTVTAPATTTTPTHAPLPAEVSTADVKPFSKFPISLSLETETYTDREKGEDKISIFNTYLYPFLKYKAAENTIFNFYPKFDLEGKKQDIENDYLAFRIDQKKILTEENNGLDFSADARYYYYMTDKSKINHKMDGLFNVRTYLDKKFTDNWSLNNHNRFYFADSRPNVTKADTLDREVELGVTPTYTFSFNDKLSTGVLTKFVHDKFQNVKDQNKLYLVPNVSYNFSDDFSAMMELEFTTYKSIGAGDRTDPMKAIPTLTYAFSPRFKTLLTGEFPLRNKQGEFLEDTGKEFSLELDFSILAF